VKPKHQTDILPSTYTRSRRQWSSDGVALLEAGIRAAEAVEQPPGIKWDSCNRLLTLLDWIDTRVATAIETVEQGGVRDVIVFRFIVYRIDVKRRAIIPGEMCDGEFVPCAYSVDILRPLAASAWLRRIAEFLGIADDRSEPDLPAADQLRDECARWLADTAYELLLADPRFCVLRDVLHRALRLEPEIVQIARTATKSRSKTLLNTHYTTAWQQLAALRRVQQASPGLLPLAFDVIKEDRIWLGRYPLAAIRYSIVENHRVTPAGWRLIARWGEEVVTVPRCFAAGRNLKMVRHYITMLTKAGVSEPPPALVMRAYLRMYGERIDFKRWRPYEPIAVLRIAFDEAIRLRGSLGLHGFINEFLAVCEWAGATKPKLNKTERRAGWTLLVRRARAWEMDQQIHARRTNVSWPCPVTTVDGVDWKANALPDSVSTLQEGLAMRHCVATYIEDCRAGRLRLFSIRTNDSGKRFATLALLHMPLRLGWTLHDVKGFANEEAQPLAQEAAREIIRLHNAPLLELKLFALAGRMDEQVYLGATQYFDVALTTLAGKPRSDFFTLLNETFGSGITPYAWRYAKERGIGNSIAELPVLLRRLA
jgi:hypothetical protein